MSFCYLVAQVPISLQAIKFRTRVFIGRLFSVIVRFYSVSLDGEIEACRQRRVMSTPRANVNNLGGVGGGTVTTDGLFRIKLETTGITPVKSRKFEFLSLPNWPSTFISCFRFQIISAISTRYATTSPTPKTTYTPAILVKPICFVDNTSTNTWKTKKVRELQKL